jgi:hypothetical protein
VGISSRNLGEGEAVTSTYGYLGWLRAKLNAVKNGELN